MKFEMLTNMNYLYISCFQGVFRMGDIDSLWLLPMRYQKHFSLESITNVDIKSFVYEDHF